MENRVALVTGASSGIGERVAIELINLGWQVIGIARSLDKLERIQDVYKDAFIPIVCDVSSQENIKRASNEILEKNLIPSLFFLNAGLAGESAAENPERFDLSFHEKMMSVNYFGVLAWVEFWEKISLKNGGANFIATSSVNAFFAPPCGAAYAASKAAIAKAFESLSLTYFDTTLRFSVIYPGPVHTAGLKGTLPFTWDVKKMGRYMVDFALSESSRAEPSFFYRILTRVCNVLPPKYILKMLAKT